MKLICGNNKMNRHYVGLNVVLAFVLRHASSSCEVQKLRVIKFSVNFNVDLVRFFFGSFFFGHYTRFHKSIGRANGHGGVIFFINKTPLRKLFGLLV